MSPPAKRGRKAYHHGDLRHALIGAAVEVITESDVSALSLRGLARRVGVTYAAPYHHFKDKNELLAEVAADGFRRMAEEMDRQLAALPPDADAVARLSAQGRGYIVFATGHPGHYRVMFRDDLADADAYPDRDGAANACYGRLLQSVRAVLPDGAGEDEIMRMAATVWSTVHGAAGLWNDGGMRAKMDGVTVDVLAERVVGQVDELMRGWLRSSRSS